MSDLTEFLLARIAEDEADARGRERLGTPPGITWDAWQAGTRRALAECEAKRRIVEEHRPTVEHVEWFDAPGVGKAEVCPSCRPAEPTEWHPSAGQAGVRPEGFVASYVLAPCPTLRFLALPYADHPDYRDEWRP